MSRSSFAVFLALSVVLPFVNYYRVSPSPSFYSELISGFFFLAAVATATALLPKRATIDRLALGFCLGLMAILGYQVVSGGYYDFMMSWTAWAFFLWLFLLAIIFGQLVTAEAGLKAFVVDRLLAALLLAALFNAFSQVAQASEWSLQIQPLIFIPAEAKYRFYTCTPAGNVAQLNQANALAWLGVTALVYLYAIGKARMPFFLLGVALLLFSSALTSSRMAWLVAPALAILLLVGRRGLGWSRARASGVGAVLVGGLFLATVTRHFLLDGCASSFARLFGEFGAGGAVPGADYRVRLDMARQALYVWWSQPVLGVGVGRFMGKTFALDSPADFAKPLDFYPHNIVLEILVSFGIVGAGLLLLSGGVWAVRLWRKRNESVQQWPLLAGLVVILVPAMLETALWYLYFLLPFGLMLGLGLGAPRGADREGGLRWRVMFPAAALAAMPMFFFATRDHMRAEHVMWLSTLASAGGELSGAAAERIPAAATELSFFAVWGQHEALRFGQENAVGLDDQLAANQRLIDNIPSPHIVARQIVLKSMAGRHDEARELFRRLMTFFPQHYEPLAWELRRRAALLGESSDAFVAMLDEELARSPREARRIETGW